MKSKAYTERSSAVARVMVVAADAGTSGPVCLELMQRGASVSAFSDIGRAAQMVRQQQFDVIMVFAREDANATALFMQLLKAEALGSPRILLLVDPAQASSHSASMFVSDEMLASSLQPQHLADATGIGVEVEPPKAEHLPAVFTEPTVKILALPSGISRDLLPKGVAEVARGEIPDAVILTEPDGDAAISAWLSAATAAVVPIIDTTGKNSRRADLCVGTLSGLGIAEAMERVKPLTARMRQLPEAYHRTRDPKHMLMARLAIRERGMTATRDPGLKEIVSYRDETAIGGVMHQAEQLQRLGLMKATFFDKLQCCPSCSSARLLVREECAKCRSADVVEEPIIHHLRCGYQGPERDFRRGRDLVCPKCRGHCEHFSVDYDKPGMLVLCNSCGHTTGDAEVGFKCLDCESGFSSDRAAIRTVFEYVLTDEGRQSAFNPPLAGYGNDNGGGTGSVRDRLRRFVTANEAAARDCTALMIKIDPDGETQQAIGHKRFHQALALYASILREVFEDDVEIMEGATTFLLMIGDESSANVEESLPEIRKELEQNLSVDLKARYHVFGPTEIKSLL